MPKFSEQEKAILQQKLLTEGERLFTAFGVKKVSIDEIVQATGIAKGSFYSFYTSKEHLYLEIVGRLQEKMWREMDQFLDKNRALPPRELMKQCFLWVFSQLNHYPMLHKMNPETAEYLYRKLPPEIIEAHTREDRHELDRLREYGIHFSCDMELATKILQALAVSFMSIQNDSPTQQRQIVEIMLEGILNEIVSDTE